MSISEERAESLRMIRDSAAGIAPRTSDLKRIRALRFTEPGFDRSVWSEMCNMGWLGALRAPCALQPRASGRYCQPDGGATYAGRCSFASVFACRFSNVRPGAMPRTTKPRSVTSIVAKFV